MTAIKGPTKILITRKGQNQVQYIQTLGKVSLVYFSKNSAIVGPKMSVSLKRHWVKCF